MRWRERSSELERPKRREHRPPAQPEPDEPAAPATSPAASGHDADVAPQDARFAVEVVASPRHLSSIQLPAAGSDGGSPAGESKYHRDVLDVAQASPEHVVAVLRPGDVFIESRDGGRTWESWRTERKITQITPDLPRYWWGLSDVDPDGTANRLARSEDGGKTWELRLTGEKMEPLHPRRMVTGEDKLFMAVGHHLLTSDDGADWRWVDVGLSRMDRIESISLEPRDALPGFARVYVGANGGRVVWNEPDGEWTEERVPGLDWHRVHAMARGTTPGGERGPLFAATSAGLFKRDADGWSRLRGPGARSLEGVFFTTHGFGVAYGVAGELWASADGGETWQSETRAVRESLGIPDGPGATLAALEHTLRHAVHVPDGILLFGDEMTIVRLRTTQP